MLRSYIIVYIESLWKLVKLINCDMTKLQDNEVFQRIQS